MEIENWPWIQHSFWTPSFSGSMLNFGGVSYLSNREIIFQTFLVGAIWVAARVVDEWTSDSGDVLLERFPDAGGGSWNGLFVVLCMIPNLWILLPWFQSFEFQSHSNVLMPSGVWKKCLHRHHNDCNCLSGAREGKLKRRPLVVGNAVDNKIICSAPRSNKSSAKSHWDPKKTGFFCSDDLVSSVLVVSEFLFVVYFNRRWKKVLTQHSSHN